MKLARLQMCAVYISLFRVFPGPASFRRRTKETRTGERDTSEWTAAQYCERASCLVCYNVEKRFQTFYTPAATSVYIYDDK